MEKSNLWFNKFWFANSQNKFINSKNILRTLAFIEKMGTTNLESAGYLSVVSPVYCIMGYLMCPMNI